MKFKCILAHPTHFCKCFFARVRGELQPQLFLYKHEDRAEKILENQKVLKLPIVRNGKQATVGYEPDIWKNWK